MTLKIIFRSYGRENKKDRPAFYSKRVAVESMLRAAEAVEARIIYLNDGPIPGDLLDVMRSTGEVVTLPGVGMRRSYMMGLRLPAQRGWPDDDLVWISEDDYLYTPDAFVRLLEAARELPADYFALYGGTDEFPVAPGVEPVWQPHGWDGTVFGEAGGHRWQRILSTASTFGVRCGALRRDLPIFAQGLLPHRRRYRDHDTCVVLQGYEPHEWRTVFREAVGWADGDLRARAHAAAIAPFKAALNIRSHRRRRNRRSLYAAVPNLAAHLETVQMPPGRDWAAVAQDTVDWARARQRPIPDAPVPLGDWPRIALVEGALRENGGLRVSLNHARHWQSAGASTVVAVVQDVVDHPMAVVDDSVPVRFLSARGGRMRSTWPLAVARLTRLARRSDVVVSGSEIGFGLVLAFAAARMARRPFAVLVQADLDEAITAWVPGVLQKPTRWVHAHVDAAICVADSIAVGVVANGLPRGRVHVVPNGVDAARVLRMAAMSPEPVVAPQAETVDLPLVVGQGRLSVQKGFDLLIRAHAEVRRAGIEHRLMIMGEGPDRPALEKLVADLGVTDTVSLPGFVANPHSHLASADLFVLSSRSEGMPLVVHEALILRVPLVATHCSTGVELLTDGGELGELVPSGSVEALASAIEKHLRDPEELRRRSALGPARASAFGAETSAATTLSILNGLVERS